MTTNPLSPELAAWGAAYVPAPVAPNNRYWRLVQADGPVEWGGRHSTFVDVWDEAGNRVVGTRVKFWNGGIVYKNTESKRGEPYAVDFPMYAAGNAYGCQVDDGIYPSDAIFGMGLVANSPHVVYKLVFQRTVAGTMEPPVLPPVEPGLTARQLVERIQRDLDALKGLI
jgi:hypothetical protein